MFRWLGLLLLLCTYCMQGIATAQNNLHLQLIDTREVVKLSRSFMIYAETERELTVNEVRKLDDDFYWHTSTNPNYGFHEKGLWLHASFSNVTDAPDWVIDLGFTQLDKVDFYLFSEGKLLAQSSQGMDRQSQTYRFPTFEVELPYAYTMDLYVRVESASNSLVAPIFIQTKAHHTGATLLDNIMWGAFYGGLLILAIYNLVLYFANREISLLAYVGYISTALLWQFVWGGHLHLFFPHGITPWLSDHMDLIFVIIGIGSGIFTYTFLDAPKTAPKSTPAIKLFIALLLIMGFISSLSLIPTLWQNGIVYVISLGAIASYMVAGFESYFNKFHPAKYFIFAWSILASCALIGMLSLVGIFPSNGFTTYCFQVGVFLEAGLFSLALMDKSRSSLETDIQQATKDLRNNMEFIEEQNARLDIARKDAVKASHVKSQFLANMSHEIRTPLNAILGFSKELTSMPLAPEVSEHVRTINSAADNLLSIVNDVLDVSKIEAGKLQINNQPFSPNVLLEDVVSLLANTAHQAGLEFLYIAEPLPDKLIGDAVRIKQVLTNLLSNALKFTSEGHICLSASGRELEHGIYELCLKVQDTGIGISQQDRKKLFTAFSQVDDALSRSYQGTGLGLVICQQLVKLMHGKITLTSEPGEGSCFAVTLRTNLLNPKQSTANHPNWKGASVALVDACPATCDSTRNILTQMGSKVTVFEDVGQLPDQGAGFDCAILAFPLSCKPLRETLYQTLKPLKANKTILLYSGQQPLSEHPPLRDMIDAQMSLPLTPLRLIQISEVRPQTEPAKPVQRLQDVPKASILAVDDMEMNLRLLNTWFQSSPVTLTLAYSGAEAVSWCEKQEFDLILMDVQMPNMDGLQASQLIRRTPLNLGTPIIAVTAHAFREEQERLLSSGMDDYLPKPIDLDALVQLIKTWCHQLDHQPVSLPSLDWQLAVKRANHNQQAAADLLFEFGKQLRSMTEEISQSWRQQDLDQLQHLVHKLHGACCYTGVPNLQSLCDEIEGALKLQNTTLVTERLPLLVNESEIVVSEIAVKFTELGLKAPEFGTA